ncbi:hypothetical protein, partial [Corynebacterium durum]
KAPPITDQGVFPQPLEPKVVEGMYKGFATCDLSMRNNGLKPVFNKNLYLSEEAFKLLKEDGNLRQKLIDFINASK